MEVCLASMHSWSSHSAVPSNDLNRELVADLRKVMKVPVYWGNRNWHPMIEDTVRQMRDDGVKRAIAFATSAFGSYSGCRQYQEDIARARAAVGTGAPEIWKIRPFSAHPLFLEAMTARVHAALAVVPGARIFFTAHSIPLSMSQASPYVSELERASAAVAAAVGVTDWKLVYQSRSGPPTQPWLEPDIADELRQLAPGSRIVIAPIGFLSDHMEVIYDLDVEARALCDERGIIMSRASTVETHPSMIRMIVELAETVPEQCPGCCLPAQRPPSTRA
jgi:ferrochelatase